MTVRSVVFQVANSRVLDLFKWPT